MKTLSMLTEFRERRQPNIPSAPQKRH